MIQNRESYHNWISIFSRKTGFFSKYWLVPSLGILCFTILFSKSLPSQLEKPSSPTEKVLQEAETLFQQKNWAEARAAYDRARELEANWHSPRTRLAVERAVECCVQLKLWDDALERAEQFIEQTQDTFEEAVGRRFLGGLYLTIPHYGTKRGASFLRGQWTQGVQVYCWRRDRREAIKQYELARERLIELKKKIGSENNEKKSQHRSLIEVERIGLNFDLAAVLAKKDIHRYSPWGWAGWWWDSYFQDEEDSEALEEADYEESRWYWHYQQPTPPSGIPLDQDGKPQFITIPEKYDPSLGDGPKIRFLLQEIQQFDTTEKKESAAKALLRWAMIARSLYGPETARQPSSGRIQYDRFGKPIPQQVDTVPPVKKVWELEDDEALTIVGGRLRVVTLPPSESPIAVLQSVAEKYPQSALVSEAHYVRALYFQTRQQFPRAIAEYRKLIGRFPDHKRSFDAKQQISTIEKPDVKLQQSGVYLPSGKPKLAFDYRNTDKITFKAFKFDLVKYVRDSMEKESKNHWQYRHIQWNLFYHNDRLWKDYLGDEVINWSKTVERLPDNRAAAADTLAPLPDPGAYVIEARTEGMDQPSRCLVLVTDIAIVQKNMVKKGLIYLADARTGQPLRNKSVRIYEHWTTWKDSKNNLHWNSAVMMTNQEGVIEYKRTQKRNTQVDAIVVGEDDRMAFSFFQRWSEHDPGYYWEEGNRYYVITDRPVYRPGDLVKFRIWYRQLSQRKYQPAELNRNLSLQIYDARNNEVKKLSVKTDRFGCASGEFELGPEPPLGVYHIRIHHSRPDARQLGGALFRVEEYKLPEFEVTVKPDKTQAKLGEKVKAKIEARYFFGAPVAQGAVTYKVFRENYNHVYWGEGEYDWLYGRGYGRYYYAYPWFPWWGRWGCFICCDLWGAYPYAYPVKGWYFPWGYYGDEEDRWRNRYESGTRKALRELVTRGRAELKEDGTYEIEIDTARAQQELGDRDHRYTVEVEVRDQSRRTIEGRGSVIVTRREFYAFVETDGGWYQPKNEAFVNVRTLTADNVPVAAAGEVIVSRIRYSGVDNSQVSEDVVKRWNAETDVDGRLLFKYPIPGEGQYRITFRTHDSGDQEVLGNGVFWVSGPTFDGRVYRFNDLEIIADKRTYKVGDTAHLLINVAQNNARILFSDTVSRGTLFSYRFIDVPSRSKVIDVPIEEKHVPNFFVEATLVRNGRVHMEQRELFVPPVEGLLDVAIQTDKETYKPGETGQVRVKVTDHTGKPVSGQVTLTAYDRAVNYIQEEFGPSPQVFFWGQKRHHQPYVHSSLTQTFRAWGSFTQPEHSTHQGGEPDGWRGYWDLDRNGLTLSGALAVNQPMSEEMPYGARGRFGGGLGGSGPVAMDSAKPMNEDSYMSSRSSFADLKMSGRRNITKESKAKGDLDMPPDAVGPMIEPEIRTNFSDTALWLPMLETDKDGTAQTEITFPQSLTTWRIRGYALTNATQVGDAEAQAVTTKNLIVRLQSPRFFIERDEVVLSANVHNYLDTNKQVTAELIIPAELFRFLGETDKKLTPDAEGNIHLKARALVKAEGAHRFDWPVKVLKEGLARITVKAMTDQESDGMRMAFPVLVHGIKKTIAQSGSYRVNQQGLRTLKVDLPEQIDPEQTRLEVTLSPSLGGVMIDALPYLVGYPYGCVEQTMSRFYPAVLVAQTLKKMGLDLETIGEQRKQMHKGDLKNRFGRHHSPVFDTEEMDRMVRAGLQRIYSFQQSDGGWGWWRNDHSSPYQSAYVLQGLHAARQAGINVDGGVYDRGMRFLQNFTEQELEKPKDEQQIGSIQTQAYIAYILSLDKRLKQEEMKKWLEALYESRDSLNNYGRSLLALTMHNIERRYQAKLLLRNVLQFVERDDSNETAWVRTPQQYWWFWWNNDIETNAWALKALAVIDPENDLSPRIVKWLLNNRRNGHYWRSTRDSALVIAALTDYMVVSGEADPDYTLTLSIDGREMKQLKIEKANIFTFDNRLVLYGLQVKPGPQTITLTKQGKGALYYSCYLSYFTKEEDITGAGNEIFIKRNYYKLIPRTEEVPLPDPGVAATLPGLQPKQPTQIGRREVRAGFNRLPLQSGDSVTSGEQIEVVLTITAKNTYDYLAFEDMKPAGCEPVERRSGGRWAGGLCSHVEFRDEKVVFFIGLLEQGQHVLRYKLRAETPGTFHALPTTGFAMYAPEVRAISDEIRLGISDVQSDNEK